MKKLTAAQKHQLMTKLLATQAGRQRIAASIQEPLRKLRDYQSIGRKAFFVDELPDGALPIYDNDPDTPAFVVGEEGDSIQEVIKTTRLLIPLFELASYPKIPFTQVKERRFDIIRRVKTKAKDELFRAEDQLIFAAIETASQNNTLNTPTAVSSAAFGMDTIADNFAFIEQNGLRVDKIMLDPLIFPVVRKAGRDFLDFETQRELLRTGFMGTLWGASVFQSSEVTAGRMYLITDPEYFGVIPVRIDITVIPADDPGARVFGWSIFENLGIGIYNSDLGLQAIEVS
ncbi:MAG TPA: hypothetical protein ENI23_00720 [bacterium]|nr:hypothetical protein [bacterium]